MESINAVITGVGGYVPDYILTNDEISKMVDTTDEWIMGRIGIKERRILKEEGLFNRLNRMRKVGIEKCFCLRYAGCVQRILICIGDGG